MNLNDINANIRLRNPWEAVDLGFAMVQNWWKTIYLPLALVTFSFATLLYFVTPKDKLWIAALVFWWFKPLYDRLVLHVVSHTLFNNQLTTWQVLQSLPSLIWNTGFFQTMTFRRFSFSRGFNLSIWQLEQLRGSERAKRQSVLHKVAHTQAVWLTITLSLLEFILVFTLFGLLILFLPEKTANNFFISFFSGDRGDYQNWIEVLDYFFYICVVTLVHPFYISANFALYINRRTQLEAWDLELDFRKMAKRLKALPQITYSLLLVVIVATLTSSFSNTVYADSINKNDVKTEKVVTEILSPTRKRANQSKRIIKETMLAKELNDKQTITYWVKKKTPKKTEKGKFSLADFLEPFAKVIGVIIEFGLWILLGIAILLLFYFRERWLHLFSLKKKEKENSYKAPEVMFGMDVRPESLPVDIIGSARKLWDAKKQRESLSLLYRGALVRLINQEQVKLRNSDTEGDVLQHSEPLLLSNKYDYLQTLTNAWKAIAYAHRNPSHDVMESLFTHWDSVFVVETKSKEHE